MSGLLVALKKYNWSLYIVLQDALYIQHERTIVSKSFQQPYGTGTIFTTL